MSQSPQINIAKFDRSARTRLINHLSAHRTVKDKEISALTPDASTREYFRIPWKSSKAVACVYPEPFDPEFHPFLDVTRLFSESGLPVPEILAIDGSAGIIIQEDLGDVQLQGVLSDSNEEEYENFQERAISLIADIQVATSKAFELKSIASRLAFDEAKLAWELQYFMEHYFKSLRQEALSHGEAAELKVELNDIAAELAARPRVLCHRDYHAANLMVDNKGNLRIVDHQDARMGPASYDLVSLLLDRQLEMPSLAEIRANRLFLLEERRLRGLDDLDPDDFAREFRLMSVQRGLKAVGTFSYQTAVCGRGKTYSQFVEPTLRVVLLAAEWLDRFPALRGAISKRLIS
jgi:N-acetylmuramate 1-kinase